VQRHQQEAKATPHQHNTAELEEGMYKETHTILKSYTNEEGDDGDGHQPYQAHLAVKPNKDSFYSDKHIETQHETSLNSKMKNKQKNRKAAQDKTSKAQKMKAKSKEKNYTGEHNARDWRSQDLDGRVHQRNTTTARPQATCTKRREDLHSYTRSPRHT
jgi:hypothetical protein